MMARVFMIGIILLRFIATGRCSGVYSNDQKIIVKISLFVCFSKIDSSIYTDTLTIKLPVNFIEQSKQFGTAMAIQLRKMCDATLQMGGKLFVLSTVLRCGTMP